MTLLGGGGSVAPFVDSHGSLSGVLLLEALKPVYCLDALGLLGHGCWAKRACRGNGGCPRFPCTSGCRRSGGSVWAWVVATAQLLNQLAPHAPARPAARARPAALHPATSETTVFRGLLSPNLAGVVESSNTAFSTEIILLSHLMYAANK
jgi:hypothetical protein